MAGGQELILYETEILKLWRHLLEAPSDSMGLAGRNLCNIQATDGIKEAKEGRMWTQYK